MRATSSHITAAATAARAVAPMAKTPWLRIRTAGERLSRSVSTMPRPIESSPIVANGPTGMSPPNSSAHIVSTQGTGSPRMAHAAAYVEWARSRPGRYAATQRAPDPGDEADLEASAGVMRVVSDALRGYDLSEDRLVDATRTLRALVHGFTALERAGGFGIPRDVDLSLDFALGCLATILRSAD